MLTSCSVRTCVALRHPGSEFCVIHAKTTRALTPREGWAQAFAAAQARWPRICDFVTGFRCEQVGPPGLVLFDAVHTPYAGLTVHPAVPPEARDDVLRHLLGHVAATVRAFRSRARMGFVPVNGQALFQATPPSPLTVRETAMLAKLAGPCPHCGPVELAWSWMVSPSVDWDVLDGRAGWAGSCPTCGHVVGLSLRLVN